jgi:hypothetical protein
MNRHPLSISPYGSLLVYKKGYTPDFVKATIEENKLRGLRIFAQLKDERLDSLDFLKDYAFLEVLDVISIGDHSFNFLSSLSNLIELSIHVEGEKEIDLSSQEHLEKLVLNWRHGKILGLEKCVNINELCLIEFREDDLKAVSNLNKLRNLKIKTSKIKTLLGISSFHALEMCLLGDCSRLRTINELAELSGVKNLVFDICPGIKNFSSLSSLTGLQVLSLNNCKQIDSIKFVEHLKELKKLTLLGNTDVVDGDLIPAKNIAEVFYKHRAHYDVQLDRKD